MAALSLAELENLKAELIRARLSGTRSIRDQNGEEITYKSDREMDAALRNVDALIAQMQSGAAINVIRFNTSKFGE